MLSLTVGVETTITANKAATWGSDNANVTVAAGALNAAEDALAPDGQALITATAGSETASCKVTIVPWSANVQALTVARLLPDYNISQGIDGTLYGNVGTALVSSTDGFVSTTALPALPALSQHRFLFTANGVFMRDLTGIYKSVDGLQTWSACISGLERALYHGFNFYYDAGSGNVYVYTVEYSTDDANRHRVIRGTIESDGTETWATVLEFYSPDEYTADPVNNIPAARHIHMVSVDSSTGDVYIGTGDTDGFCRIMLSEDNGGTWRVLGDGAQKWRTLSVWFTTNYIYWNMDAAVTQQIWRLARTNLAAQSTANDLSEAVATLDNGSHWYHCFGTDPDGNAVVIMAQSAEGQLRDWRGRLFAVYEAVGGTVTVQEIYTFDSSTPDVYTPYVRLEPMLMAGDDIYLRSVSTAHAGCWKMRFVT